MWWIQVKRSWTLSPGPEDLVVATTAVPITHCILAEEIGLVLVLLLLLLLAGWFLLSLSSQSPYWWPGDLAAPCSQSEKRRNNHTFKRNNLQMYVLRDKWSVYQKVITCFQADSFALASLGWHISLWVFCLYIEFMCTYYSTMVYLCRYSTQKCRFSVCIVHLFILPSKDTS